MQWIKQGALTPIPFLLISSTDHVTGLTSATATITLSKNGAAFAGASTSGGAVTITERGSGVYWFTPKAGDTDTLGALAIHITATGADPVDMFLMIVAVDVADTVRFGLTALPNAAAGVNGGLPLGNASGYVTVATVNDKTGYSLSVTPPTAAAIATAVWGESTRTLTSFGTLAADTAAAVWAAGTRTLSSFGSVAADAATAVWGTATRTLSAFGFTVDTNANATETTIAANVVTLGNYVDTEILAIKTNTDKLAGLTADEVLYAISGLANKTTYDPTTGDGVIYAPNGSTVRRTYTITKNSDGVITSVTPDA